MILLKNDKDEPTALIYSTAYTRTDTKDATQRPVSFIYNGGPGSASVWLHMGAFGPQAASSLRTPKPLRLRPTSSLTIPARCWTRPTWCSSIRSAPASATPSARRRIRISGASIRMSDRWLEFIITWVSRNNRWNSPKFLIGESYGTFRSAALSNYLQIARRHVLQRNRPHLFGAGSPHAFVSMPGDDMSYIFYLPSYAATAWYHKMLQDRPDNAERVRGRCAPLRENGIRRPR